MHELFYFILCIIGMGIAACSGQTRIILDQICNIGLYKKNSYFHGFPYLVEIMFNLILKSHLVTDGQYSMGTGGTSTMEETMARISTVIRETAMITWAVEVMNIGLKYNMILSTKFCLGEYSKNLHLSDFGLQFYILNIKLKNVRCVFPQYTFIFVNKKPRHSNYLISKYTTKLTFA